MELFFFDVGTDGTGTDVAFDRRQKFLQLLDAGERQLRLSEASAHGVKRPVRTVRVIRPARFEVCVAIFQPCTLGLPQFLHKDGVVPIADENFPIDAIQFGIGGPEFG